MLARTWIFVALALGCAILVVRAEEAAKVEEPTAEIAVEAAPAAETEPATEELEARYKGGSSKGGSGRKGHGGGSKRGGSSNNSDNSDSSNNSGNGRGSGHGSGSGRGSGRGNGSGNGGGANVESLAGSGLRNKVINEGTRYLGTKRTYSGSTKVVRSRKDRWFSKNFVNTVTSNLKTLAKKVHTDTKVLVKKPLTVDNLKVHQQTNYVKNIYPRLEKVWVEQYKEVIAPSHAETVSRSASAQKRTIRHRLQVSSSSRHRNLGTRYESTQELGVIGGNGGGFGGGNGGGRGGGSSNNNNSNSSNNRGGSSRGSSRGGSRGASRKGNNNNRKGNNNSSNNRNVSVYA